MRVGPQLQPPLTNRFVEAGQRREQSGAGTVRGRIPRADFDGLLQVLFCLLPVPVYVIADRPHRQQGGRRLAVAPDCFKRGGPGLLLVLFDVIESGEGDIRLAQPGVRQRVVRVFFERGLVVADRLAGRFLGLSEVLLVAHQVELISFGVFRLAPRQSLLLARSQPE